MTANNSILVNTSQSIATSDPKFADPAPKITSGNNPQDIIKPISGEAGGDLLVYPSDRPKYYLQFDIHNYSRNSLQEVGALGPALKTIVLPLSANLTDLTSEKWDDNFQVGQLTGAAIDNIVIPTINSIRDLTGGIGNRLGGIAATATGEDAAKAALGSISGGASALLGFAPNQFLTVLYVSPMYKRHHFTWAVSPDIKAESDTLRKIGNAFKNAMSPKAALGGLVWKFPKIFKIGFRPNSRMMYKFKPAVLETCEINYTPTGRAAFFKDPNPDAGENAPEGMTISLRFLEIEFWQEGNFNETNDPNNVYTKET